MAASTESLPALLAQVSLDDHEEILKTANAAIKKSKTDLEAQHVKAIALLNLNRYSDAIKVFEDVGSKLKEKDWLAYAYALYRFGKPTEAVKVAKTHSGGRGMRHVLAQASYRLENFEQAVDIYRELSTQETDYEYDVKINSAAVDAQLGWSGKGHLALKRKPAREDLEAFETAYNAACASISRGELAQGEICLKRAKDLCNAASDLTEEEKKSEILPITVQQVYVLTQLGKVDEAEQLTTTIPFAEIKELSTRYIAQANSIATSKEHANPYLSHRLFHASPRPPQTGTDPHFEFQSNILRQNEYIMDLKSQKYAGVAHSTANTILNEPSPSIAPSVTTAAVLNAAAHSRNAMGKASLKEILPLLEKRPNDVGLILTITNLYILTNNHTAAIHLLETFFKRLEQSTSAADLDVRHAPGLVATLISLYSLQGRHSQSRAELAKAATYWRHKSKSPPKPLLTAAGTALLASRDENDLSSAAEIFSSLHDQDSTDRSAIAGLVAAYSITDPSKLSSDLIDSLPEVNRLIADVDAAALENAGVAIPASQPSLLPISRKRPAEKARPTKSKKIRKVRMPKDYVEGKKMDPERWLPMRDRTYYRPKGRKGKKKAEGLTQGGAVVEEKQETKQQGGGGGGGGQKKKKGKGKGKW